MAVAVPAHSAIRQNDGLAEVAREHRRVGHDCSEFEASVAPKRLPLRPFSDRKHRTSLRLAAHCADGVTDHGAQCGAPSPGVRPERDGAAPQRFDEFVVQVDVVDAPHDSGRIRSARVPNRRAAWDACTASVTALRLESRLKSVDPIPAMALRSRWAKPRSSWILGRVHGMEVK